MMRPRFLIFIFLCVFCTRGFAATILKANEKGVLVQFDVLEENYVTGDKLISMTEGIKQGLIEITKVKGSRFIARVLDGTATVGMTLQKFDAVTTTKAPEPTGTQTSAASVDNVTIRFGSVAVVRGIPYKMSYTAGSWDFVYGGFIAGLFIFNAPAPANSEIDVYMGYRLSSIDWALTTTLAHFSYQASHEYDTVDAAIDLTYRVLSFSVAYHPDHFGSGSTNLYAKLALQVALGERWKLYTHVGNSIFGKPEKVGYGNYADGKIGFLYSTSEFGVEFGFTDTTRQPIGGGKHFADGAAGVTILKKF